jgi:lactoylglutathione lyase
MTASSEPTVSEMRLVVTTGDYDSTLGFYRDVLGLRQVAVFDSPGGRVTLLDAGRATLELTDAANARYIDEVEVGRRVAGPIRVAFKVPDADVMTERVAAAGATVVAGPTLTPWGSRNARVDAPAGLQLTLFSSLEPDA